MNNSEYEHDISEEEIEAVAKNVYEQLEQEWDNRSERYYGFMTDTPPWANLPRQSNSAGVGVKVSFGHPNTQPLGMDTERALSNTENQLELLVVEIYFLLRTRVKIEKERYGFHATYWHHQNFW